MQIKPAYKGDIIQYKWKPALYLNNDSIAYPVSTPTNNITYQLSVTGVGNCVTTKNIAVKVLHTLEIPNTFSPNGDGINDKWVLNNLEYFTGCSVNIFNRSGQNVYSSSAYSNAWDGTYNGKPLPVGTYYYVIKTQDAVSSTRTGYITLLR
jgi:gliding motility-associated-like protein